MDSSTETKKSCLAPVYVRKPEAVSLFLLKMWGDLSYLLSRRSNPASFNGVIPVPLSLTQCRHYCHRMFSPPSLSGCNPPSLFWLVVLLAQVQQRDFSLGWLEQSYPIQLWSVYNSLNIFWYNIEYYKCNIRMLNTFILVTCINILMLFALLTKYV